MIKGACDLQRKIEYVEKIYYPGKILTVRCNLLEKFNTWLKNLIKT